jgi:hypothetical protein
MGVAWMAGQTVVTDIDQEIMVQVNSFELMTSRHLNPLTGQVLSTAFLFLGVSAKGDVQPPPPEIRSVWVHFTDEPHPNVGAIDGVFLDLYVPIVETQTWWQVLSNGPSFLAADVNNTLGVTGVQLLNDQSSTGKDPAKQIAAVRERLQRRADMSA